MDKTELQKQLDALNKKIKQLSKRESKELGMEKQWTRIQTLMEMRDNLLVQMKNTSG